MNVIEKRRQILQLVCRNQYGCAALYTISIVQHLLNATLNDF